MAGVALEGVSRIFPGPVAALEDVNLVVQDRELLVLVGPSGSGKTTLLRVVAGLEPADSGRVCIDRRDVSRVPARQRDVALVFQSYALYPHLSVRRNLASGLTLREGLNWWRPGKWQRRQVVDERVREAASALAIEELLDRLPGELSGGQRQRVALGRALVRRPAVYLLDEPLSNVDVQLRQRLRSELKRLHQQLAATMLYVTHDQDEALTMGDRVAVLAGGRIQQVDTPEELVSCPRNRWVAGFLGVPEGNFVSGRLESVAGAVQFVAGEWSVTLDSQAAVRVKPYLHQAALLAVRPEGVRLELGDTGGIAARVTGIHPLNGTISVRIEEGRPASRRADGDEYRSGGGSGLELMSRASSQGRMAVGDLVSMHLDMRLASVFDPATGENLGWPRMVEGN